MNITVKIQKSGRIFGTRPAKNTAVTGSQESKKLSEIAGKRRYPPEKYIKKVINRIRISISNGSSKSPIKKVCVFITKKNTINTGHN